jgi:tetratricopeptide (TPR) repeat protein
MEFQYRLAVAYLANKRIDEYRQACSDMLAGIDSPTDLVAANRAVWACALSPQSIDDANSEQLTRIAEELVEATEEREGIPAYHRRLNTAGAAYYRAGNFAEAVQACVKSEEAYEEFIVREIGSKSGRTQAGKIWNWLFLAMTHFELGNTAQAEEFLKMAEGTYGEGTPEQLARALGVPSPTWDQRVAVDKLLEEAQGKKTQEGSEQPPEVDDSE